MYTFNYHVPKNVNEAITIFKDSYYYFKYYII